MLLYSIAHTSSRVSTSSLVGRRTSDKGATDSTQLPVLNRTPKVKRTIIQVRMYTILESMYCKSGMSNCVKYTVKQQLFTSDLISLIHSFSGPREN